MYIEVLFRYRYCRMSLNCITLIDMRFTFTYVGEGVSLIGVSQWY